MELRKVQEIGGGTALISLPKEWVKRNRIGKGSVLVVEEGRPDYLLIYPLSRVKRGPREVTIKYPAEEKLLINRITAAYLLGYDIIRVVGKDRIAYRDRARLKASIRHLVGLEIVEEDSKTLMAQFLMEPNSLNPRRILLRMHLLTSSMHRDALQALIEDDTQLARSVVERDDEVDRLYFLTVRLLRTAALDPKLAADYQLNPIDLLDHRVAANEVESIGDAAVAIASNGEQVLARGHIPRGWSETLATVANLLEGMQETAVKAFADRKMEAAQRLIDEYRQLDDALKRLEAAAVGDPDPALWSILSAIRDIGRSTIDIADLAIPTYPLL
jgi:phosphate uptake regulator